MLIIYPLALVTENTFIPLMLGAFLITLSAAESEKPKDYIFAGLLFGLASLTRSVISLAVLFIVIWLYFNTKDKRSVILLPLCMLVLTLPWATRNTLLNDRLTYIESSLGYDLHMGYHPESTGTFKYGVSLELFPYLDDSVRDELGMERALGFIREDLGRVPQLILYKLGHFFGLEKRAISYFYANNFFGEISLTPLSNHQNEIHIMLGIFVPLK